MFKRRIISNVLSLAAACLLACTQAVVGFRRVGRLLFDIMVGPPMHSEPIRTPLHFQPLVARSINAHMLRVEAPTIRAGWRMCPSI
jgi:hypothetical protein